MRAITPSTTGPRANGSRSYFDIPRLGWFAALPCLAILLTIFHHLATGVWWLADPVRMADFVAGAPFQYRVLLPVIVAGITDVAPWLGVNVVFTLIEVAVWVLLILVAHRVLVALDIGGSDFVRRLLAITIVVPVALHVIVPDLRFNETYTIDSGVYLLGEWRLVALFRYVYDLPAALLTLALALFLIRFIQDPTPRRFAAYLGVFALAAMNRETAVFMIPASIAACWGVLDRRMLVLALIAQVIVFAAVHGGVKWVFPGIPNPNASVGGTAYENHLVHNLGQFSSPLYAVTYFARFSAGFYLPVLLLARYLDPALGRMLICFAVPFLATAVYLGRIVEQRVVVEVVPLLWLCAMQVIWAYSREQSARADGPIPVRYPESLTEPPTPIAEDVAAARADGDWLRVSAASERVPADNRERQTLAQHDGPLSWNRRHGTGGSPSP